MENSKLVIAQISNSDSGGGAEKVAYKEADNGLARSPSKMHRARCGK